MRWFLVLGDDDYLGPRSSSSIAPIPHNSCLHASYPRLQMAFSFGTSMGMRRTDSQVVTLICRRRSAGSAPANEQSIRQWLVAHQDILVS
jgi:hypothetical protein